MVGAATLRQAISRPASNARCQLIRKGDATWRAQVQAALEALSAIGQLLRVEHAKGDAQPLPRSAGGTLCESAPTRWRRNRPNSLPVVVLGRLAVDEACSARGVAGGLLKAALLRPLHAADRIGART